MTFYEKYPKLKERGFLTEMLTEIVFATMSLEDQQIPKGKVKKIFFSLLEDENFEYNKLRENQIS